MNPKKTYAGYLGANVNRIELISIILDLRAHGVSCFGVPIKYRDCKNISFAAAFKLACDFSGSIAPSIDKQQEFKSKIPPAYWLFNMNSKNLDVEKSGGVVMIDRIDGHVWTDSENEEYMYDYNNIL